MDSKSSIFAPATAPGKAGVAILRISGPHTKEALRALGLALPSARLATLATFIHPHTKLPIDRGLALWFPGPHSFTGEDMAELQVHGSRAVLNALCEALASLQSFRLAEPGEFARRAFLNGKMDLAEVEGLADLIDAETDAQRAQALRIVQGEMSLAFEGLRKGVLQALAHMEALIDFSDEDIPPALEVSIQEEVQTLRADISRMLADGHRGERIREGVSIVILGAPNAGKSSLLNAMARRDAAIVSPMAGTTRDAIEVHLDIAGYAAMLVDTAGLRDSADPIEQEGIRRAQTRAQAADIRLLLFDGAALPSLDAGMLAMMDAHDIALVSKADALTVRLPVFIGGLKPLPVSIYDPGSIAQLLTALESRLGDIMERGIEAPLITRARHREALIKAERHLERFLKGGLMEIRCEELRQAGLSLGKITGKIAVDELLDHIFREFCIGK